MARKRGFDEELDMMDLNEEQEVGEDENLSEEYDADAFDDEYVDDEYDDEYEDEDEDEEEEHAQERGGFFSSVFGRVITAVIALLVLAVIVLLVWRFVGMRKEPMEITSDPLPLPMTETATKAPGAIVFAPVADPTQEPTQEPTASPTPTSTPTPEPTDTPEPTATPLPIILTNTPTPSPSPTASPTPTPSPSPTPSPKPTATPRVDLGEAETNREANLRESASANGKVKKTLKKGEALTIHEAALDKSGKVWYFVSVNDLDTQGWMRDYVVNVSGDIVIPTPTPEATATPKAEASEDKAAASQTAEPEATVGLGTGKTVKDANVRKIMNGKVITQLRTGRAVIIHDAKLDKNGDLWYEIQVQGQTTRGFVRDYLIKLDKGVEIAKPTPTPKAGETPAAQTEEAAVELLDREVVGKAKTNRAANIREEAVSGAKIVTQLKKNTELLILSEIEEGKNLWYEVATQDGKIHGFARDYVLDVSQINGEILAVPVVENAATSNNQLIGNSQSKVYHTHDCGHLPTKNRVTLPNTSYAQARGYRLCEYCQ